MPSPHASAGPRRLALVLVLALLAGLAAAPVQAAPPPGSLAVDPLAHVIDWIQDLLADLGWPPADRAEEPEAPKPTYLPEGSCVDPNGNPVACPESDSNDSSLEWPVPPGETAPTDR